MHAGRPRTAGDTDNPSGVRAKRPSPVVRTGRSQIAPIDHRELGHPRKGPVPGGTRRLAVQPCHGVDWCRARHPGVISDEFGGGQRVTSSPGPALAEEFSVVDEDA
jgi:hypothetical protein